MSNTTIKISLPVDLKTTLQKLAQQNQYSTVSGFVQQLIRQESVLDKEKEKLRKMIKVGIESGMSDTSPDIFFDKLEEELVVK
jgi:metal-responsive CopG/Arc/MetJ family transcriptional regulator